MQASNFLSFKIKKFRKTGLVTNDFLAVSFGRSLSSRENDYLERYLESHLQRWRAERSSNEWTNERKKGRREEK